MCCEETERDIKLIELIEKKKEKEKRFFGIIVLQQYDIAAYRSPFDSLVS
jgi:hypothetical protein